MVDLMSLLSDALIGSFQMLMLNDFGKNMFPYRIKTCWKRILNIWRNGIGYSWCESYRVYVCQYYDGSCLLYYCLYCHFPRKCMEENYFGLLLLYAGYST